MAGMGAAGGGAGEFMLFGVRVVVDSMRKSVSLNNLSQYEQPRKETDTNNNSNGKGESGKDDVAAADGYASADDAVPNASSSSHRAERKRGVPWTEEEHKLFLLGLQTVGKGDWRGISRSFVKTRTPTQVASHAQKYFLRRSNLNRRRRRSSLFDITTDSVTVTSMEEEQGHRQENNDNNGSQSRSVLPSPSEASNIGNYSAMPAFSISINPVASPFPIDNSMEKLSLAQRNQAINSSSMNLIRPVAVPAAHTSGRPDLNLNLTAPLDLFHSDPREPSTRHSAFQSMSSFNSGDSIISVA